MSLWFEILGALGIVDEQDIEYELDPDVGPLQFHGREDYIRGLGPLPSSALRTGAGFQDARSGGKSFTALRTGKGGVTDKPGSTLKIKPGLTMRAIPPSAFKKAVDYAAVAGRARVTAKNAAAIAKSLSNFKSSPAHTRHVVGAAPPLRAGTLVVKRTGSPRPLKITVPKYKTRKVPTDASVRKLAKGLLSTATKLGTKANTYERGAKSADDKHMRGIAAAQKTYGKGGAKGSHIVGDGHFYEILGAVPDPNNPGYLTDGSIDPYYTGGSDGYAGQGSTSYDPGATADLPPGPEENYGMPEPPTMESDGVRMDLNVDYLPDPSPDGGAWMSNFDSKGDPKNLPLGCIVYDKTMPFPISGVGSRTRFFGGAPGDTGGSDSGFEFGNYTDAPNGHADGWYFFFANAHYDHVSIDLRYKKDDAHPTGADHPPYYMDGYKYDPAKDPGRARAEASMMSGWGPLIGNPRQMSPNDPGMKSSPVPLWTWGLKYDIGSDVWFWYWAEAPDWARAPVLAARLAAALLDYQSQLAAAKTEYLQAVATAKKNAQDAAAQAAQWEKDQASIQHQADMQQQQQDLAQQQADASSALAYQQQDDAYSALDLQQAQAEEKAYEAFLQAGGDPSAWGASGGGGVFDDDAFDGGSDRDQEQAQLEAEDAPRIDDDPFSDSNWVEPKLPDQMRQDMLGQDAIRSVLGTIRRRGE